MIAVFLGCFWTWQPHLGPGERAMILVIATDRKQARVIFRYVRALLALPMLSRLIDRETNDVIDLTNDVSIEIAVASYRTTRGYTLAAVLADELAFWRTDDSAEPDYEILDVAVPAWARCLVRCCCVLLLPMGNPAPCSTLFNAITAEMMRRCFCGKRRREQ